jgi:DNA (cytosine-5)-methyltransferase 1
MTKKIKIKETSLIKNYTLPEIPNDPEKLAKYRILADRAISALNLLLSRPNLTPTIYKLALETSHKNSELMLKTDLRLSYIIKRIKTKQGKRTDIKKSTLATDKSKKEVIEQIFGLTVQQAKVISRLTEWGVSAAIQIAKEKGITPTRTLAVSLIKEKEKNENNKSFRPTGIYSEYAPSKINHLLRLLNPVNCGSAFTNVGFDEYYLKENGFNNLVSNEFLSERAKWYRDIYKHSFMLEGDIREKMDEYIKISKQKNIQIGIFTPPCQTFTVAGKRDFNDPRTTLFLTMLEIIRQVDYSYVLIENVKEYLTASPKALQYILKGKTIVEYIKSTLEGLGYWVNIDIINAAEYVTPQSRRRCIILASKTGLWKFPKKDKFQITVWDAIGHLPSLEPGEDSGILYHKDESGLNPCEIEFLRHTPSGRSAWDNAKRYQPCNKDGTPSQAKHKASFSREDKNKPATTITGDNNCIGGHNCVHPGRPLTDGTWSDPRTYTTLEKLLLCGLPGDYKIPDWADNALISEVLGELFLPKLCLKLVQNIPETKLLTYTKEK